MDELIAADLQRRPRKDEAGGQQCGRCAAGPAEGNGAADEASQEGQLSERGKPEQFQGAYAEIVKGVNDDAGCDSAAHRRRQSHSGADSSGKIDELIAQTYKGDHEKMKLAVNNVAAVLQNLQKEMARLTRRRTKVSFRSAASPSSFRAPTPDIVKGVNEMLDAILLPIGEGNRILGLIRGGNLRERSRLPARATTKR